MLFALGARFGGQAPYVKDERLHYANSFVGMFGQKVDSTQDLPTGEGRVKTQPDYFSLASEGLCVGHGHGEAVTDDYLGTSSHAFTGGTIKRVAVDVSGEPYLDLERQARAVLARE